MTEPSSHLLASLEPKKKPTYCWRNLVGWNHPSKQFNFLFPCELCYSALINRLPLFHVWVFGRKCRRVNMNKPVRKKPWKEIQYWTWKSRRVKIKVWIETTGIWCCEQADGPFLGCTLRLTPTNNEWITDRLLKKEIYISYCVTQSFKVHQHVSYWDKQ